MEWIDAYAGYSDCEDRCYSQDVDAVGDRSSDCEIGDFSFQADVHSFQE